MIIRDFAEANHLSQRQAINYLRHFKAMDYLAEFYDVEHTLSPSDTVATIKSICAKHGGQL